MTSRDTLTLIDFTKAIASAASFDALLDQAYKVIAGRAPFIRLELMIVDEDRAAWTIVGRRDRKGRRARCTLPQGLMTPDLRDLASHYRDRAQIVPDYANGDEGLTLSPTIQDGVRSGIHAYIFQGSTLIAVLSIQDNTIDRYTEADADYVFEVAQAMTPGLEGVAEILELERYRDDLAKQHGYLRRRTGTTGLHERIVGSSAALRSVLDMAARVAPTDTTVLIRGETGTGKEVIAREIHRRSRRHNLPLMTVNCAALSAELVSSELFGHEAGAFTGARTTHRGRFELADHGTLFLDEVGDIPPETQVRLLRVLELGEFERVGSSRTLTVDVRIIAATHRDPEAMVAEGRFRADLLFRLNTFPVHIPPLRERREDITELANHFLLAGAERNGVPVPTIDDEVFAALQRYPWCGNVRELRNVIERTMILCEGGRISLRHLPMEVAYGSTEAALRETICSHCPGALHEHAAVKGQPGPAQIDDLPLDTLEDAVRTHILKALNRSNGKISGSGGAAQLLDINPKTLESKMKKLGIRRAWG